MSTPPIRQTVAAADGGLLGGETLSVTTSAATALDDYLVCFYANEYERGLADDPPTGTEGTWALLDDGHGKGAGGYVHGRVWGRRVTTAGAQTVTVRGASSSPGVAITCVVVQGVVAVDDARGGGSQSKDATHVAPAGTATVPDALVLRGYSSRRATNYTIPSGTARLAETDGAEYITQLVTSETATSTSSPARTATAAPETDSHVTHTIVLRGVQAAPTPPPVLAPAEAAPDLSTDEVVVYVRDPNYERTAQLSDFTQLDFTTRFNDVGTWELQLDRRTANAVPMTTPGFGIEVTFGGVTVLSGPILGRKHVRTKDTSTVTITGADDMVWLKRRLASPSPSEAFPPYTVAAHDVRTGLASTVLRAYVSKNLGAEAIVARKLPGLALASDPLIGTTVTGRARWQTLLEVLQGLAISGGGLGFGIRQAIGSIEFFVYQPEDKTATVRFSEELGNLAEFEYESVAPEVTYVYAGGGGELTARTIREGSHGGELATWGRIEQFVDQRQTTDAGELQQAITEALAEGGETASLSAKPIDTQGMAYLTHYQLGDKVTVAIDSGEIREVIRELTVSLTPNGPRLVQPTVGTPGRHDVFRLFRQFRASRRQISNLERE